MATPKVILYYAFRPLADPEAVRLWQQTLCESLGLKGRIIVSPHGINGTLGGDVDVLKQYVHGTRAYPPFRDLDVKWSDGSPLRPDGSTSDFPRLRVRARDEVVTFGVPDELEVDERGVVGGGTPLTPEELHELVEREDVVFFDGRNAVESELGRFKGAVRPAVSTTREFVELLDSGAYDHLKDKPVVTYCTGGIRCEVLTPLMRHRGFEQVYQLDGGIVRYGETFGDDGLWEGSLYVFDGRDQTDFSDHAAVVGRCDRCGSPSRAVRDCDLGSCVAQFVRCDDCAAAAGRCATHG